VDIVLEVAALAIITGAAQESIGAVTFLARDLIVGAAQAKAAQVVHRALDEGKGTGGVAAVACFTVASAMTVEVAIGTLLAHDRESQVELALGAQSTRPSHVRRAFRRRLAMAEDARHLLVTSGSRERGHRIVIELGRSRHRQVTFAAVTAEFSFVLVVFEVARDTGGPAVFVLPLWMAFFARDFLVAGLELE
jgi:hypothetical protein